ESVQLRTVECHRLFGRGRRPRVLVQVQQYLKVSEVLRTRVVRGENLEKRLEALLEGGAADVGRPDLVAELVPRRVQHFEQETFPALELILDRSPRDAGAPRDVVGAGLVVALFQDALGGGLYDAGPRAFAIGAGPTPAAT